MLFLCQQLHSFQQAAMLRAGRHDVDARGVDAAVTENVCQLCNIFLYGIKRPGKEIPQIVREHLARIYICLYAQALHGCPDVASVEGSAGSRAEDHPLCNPGHMRVLQQESFQLAGKKNTACLAFALYSDLTAPDCIDGEVLQLRHADACGADRLQHHPQTCVFPRGGQQTSVFRFCQLAVSGLVYFDAACGTAAHGSLICRRS